MRVLITAQYFPPDMGGGATRALNVAKGLLKAGCIVTIVSAFPHYPTGNIPEKYRWKPFSIEYEGMLKIIRTFVPPVASEGFAKRFLLFASFIASSLFALPFVGKVNVIWAANPNVASFFAGLTYKVVKRCPLVQNIDDLWPDEFYNFGILKAHALLKIGESIARVTYTASAALTPISPAYVDVLVSKYKISSQKIHVVPAGVDLDNFKANAVKKKNEQSIFKVLYIGALSSAYDFDSVLKAARMLSHESRIKFIIQGEGELSNALRLKVKEMDLENVDLILKVVSRGEVAEILSSSDALLLPLQPLHYTGISSKLYEYQASGKPVICCSKGQPAEYVSQTNSGIIVEPGDFESLGKSILYLFQNRKVAGSLGEAGRSYVENNMSLQKIGIRMKRIFESLLAEAKSAKPKRF
jgi:glycosyltransferase involved in cell wall biosynthesis